MAGLPHWLTAALKPLAKENGIFEEKIAAKFNICFKPEQPWSSGYSNRLQSKTSWVQ